MSESRQQDGPVASVIGAQVRLISEIGNAMVARMVAGLAAFAGGSGGHTGLPLSWMPCRSCGQLAPPPGGNGGPWAVWCPHCGTQIS